MRQGLPMIISIFGEFGKENWKKAIYLNAEKTLNKTKSELSAR